MNLITILLIISIILNLIFIFKEKILKYFKKILFKYFNVFDLEEWNKETDKILNKWMKDDININNVNINEKEETKW